MQISDELLNWHEGCYMRPCYVPLCACLLSNFSSRNDIAAKIGSRRHQHF